MYHRDSPEPFNALRKHDEYYLPGGDLFFLVEQNHFRVHRYFFERESQFFKIKLATPASPGASRQGTSESTAIVLDDVKADHFARFLWVFYNPKYSLYHAKVDDWVAILDLAFRWGFSEVKALVIREIERLYMTDIYRVVVYHKYDIDRRLLLANYSALVAREQPLTLQEGMDLGMETTLKIFRAREIARATPGAGGVRSPRPVTLPAGEMRSLVQDLFEITLIDEDVVNTPLEETKPVEPANTNGMDGTKKTTTNGTGGKAEAMNSSSNSGTATSPNGSANTNTTKNTTESTAPKTGAGDAATKAANSVFLDDKTTALNGAKHSATTTTNGTSKSTTPQTPTTNPGSGDPIFSRMFQGSTDSSVTGNGTADANKNETEGKNGDTKEKDAKDEASSRPDTPTTGKKANNRSGAKKTPLGL